MKELKKAANWNIAATHYLTAGFAMPILISIAGNFLIGALSISSDPFIVVVRVILYILSIWLGVMYSARYLRKTYIIADKNNIITTSIIYFVVIHLGYIVIQYMRGSLSITQVAIVLVSFGVGAVLFFYFSKKYVQNTEIQPQVTPDPAPQF